jgi:ribosomal protein S27E
MDNNQIIAKIVYCPQCHKAYKKTYHGEISDREQYEHLCTHCGAVIFKETGGDVYKFEDI